MSKNPITELTPEQEALIPVYREKWRAIALSTDAIDRQKATEAVKLAYAAIGKKKPEILFFDSPYTALKELRSHLLESQWESKVEYLLLCLEMRLKLISSDHQWENCFCGLLSWLLTLLLMLLRWNLLHNQLSRKLCEPLTTQMEVQLSSQLNFHLIKQLQVVEIRDQADDQMSLQLARQLKVEFPSDTWYWGRTPYDSLRERWASYGSQLDFCISVLNCTHNRRKWLAFQSLVKECGWIYPFEKTCIVCARPIKLSFDNENRLHAEGEPAIQFADGYSLYYYHSLKLPEKYGKLHPHQWQVQWVLEEKNVELRRALIQGIGFARLCQELQATELDYWQEYTLLKIDIDFVEPIYLLKMTCPSTGFIHALRVPPDMKSAREAIRWVNWGVDPEEFSVQS